MQKQFKFIIMAYNVIRYECAAPKDLSRLNRSNAKGWKRLEQKFLEMQKDAEVQRQKLVSERLKLLRSKGLIEFL